MSNPQSQYGEFGSLPGRLFIVEGIDGSGKSTQLDLLRKWLTAQGYCAHLSEWNSSPLVRETTKFGKAERLLSPLSFSLIHAADFADRLERTSTRRSRGMWRAEWIVNTCGGSIASRRGRHWRSIFACRSVSR
jgi:hypothetical protein